MLQNVHDRLANEAAMVDQGERGAAQADLHIAGSLMQALGALLLELGRATRGVNLNTQPVSGSSPSRKGQNDAVRSLDACCLRLRTAPEGLRECLCLCQELEHNPRLMVMPVSASAGGHCWICRKACRRGVRTGALSERVPEKVIFSGPWFSQETACFLLVVDWKSPVRCN
jgi:hypothetical protein